MLNKEFKELINEMEDNIVNYNDIINYHHKLIRLYNLNKETGLDDILNLVKFERDSLCFKIQDYELIPIYKIYPKIKEFTEDHVEYIKLRHDSTRNYLLKSFYSWILCKKIENREALTYLKSYIDSLWRLYWYLKENDLDYYMAAQCLTNAYVQTNDYVYENHGEIKSEIINFIFNDEISDNAAKKFLIYFILENKRFKDSDEDNVDKLCWDIANAESNLHEAIEFLKLGKEFDKSGNYDWNTNIASNYETLMDSNDEYYVKFRYCRNAINYYKPVNQQKVEELTLKFEQIRDNLNFNEIHHLIDISELNKLIDNKRNEINEYSFEMFIDYLINDVDFPLIPKPYGSYDVYSPLNSPFNEFISREIVDENNNSVRQINSNEGDSLDVERNHRKYMFYLEIYTIPYLNKVFEFAFCKELFNYNNIIRFLNTFEFFNNSNLMKVIEPIINEYFDQLSCYLIEPNLSNFSLFIDSISSKIELLIKEISSSNGIVTTQVRNDDVTTIFRLEQTLKNDNFINLTKDNCDDDFLRKILIEPGLNLRNKSSHGLDLNIYNFSYANLLFLCFLRLIKYL